MYIIPYSYRGLPFQFFYVSHKYYSKGYKPCFHEEIMKRLLKISHKKNRSISAPIFYGFTSKFCKNKVAVT
jgi:hypothetical protein